MKQRTRKQLPDDCYIHWSDYRQQWICRTPDDEKIATGNSKTECYLNALKFCKNNNIPNRIYYGATFPVWKIKMELERRVKKDLNKDELINMETYY